MKRSVSTRILQIRQLNNVTGIPVTGNVPEQGCFIEETKKLLTRKILRRRKPNRYSESEIMGFFQSSITVLQKLVVAIGCGLGAWGLVNLLEGYGQDNPGAKSQGIKQLMAGGGIALIGTQIVPLLSTLF